MKAVKIVMKDENEKIITTKDINIQLTKEEQQVLYYVAEYIVFSLLQKYKRTRDQGKNAHITTYALQFLDNLKIRSSTENSKKSFLEFTRSWISIVDRGGLIKVNDDMFIFCRRIENSVRTVLKITEGKILGR